MSERLRPELAANRTNWDDRAVVHARSTDYDVDGLVADPARISTVVLNDLDVLAPHLPDGSVRGLSLLHLQCHLGTDTLSWARLGATGVHGLDLSPASLAHARDIAARAGADITYVEGDACHASSVIDRRFDVVVTSVGTIVWLPDLAAWARSIADLLVPGGVFMVRDDHPLLASMDFQPWTTTRDYLGDGTALSYESDASYTSDSDGLIAHTTNYEWRHDLAEVVGSLLAAGLEVRALHELPLMDWAPFEGLVRTDRGFVLPPDAPRIPLSFAVVARRPTSGPGDEPGRAS